MTKVKKQFIKNKRLIPQFDVQSSAFVAIFELSSPSRKIYIPLPTYNVKMTQEQDALENGMLIKFYFSKFMIVDYGCLFFSLQGLLLSFVYYDSDSQIHKSKTTDAILWLILLGSIIQIILTVLRSRARLQLRKYQFLDQQGVSIMSRHIFQPMISEICMILLQPYPLINNYGFETSDQLDEQVFDFKYNHLLCLFMMSRLFMILRIIISSSKYASPRAIRIGRMYGCKTGYKYVVRALLKDYPMKLLGLGFFFQLFYFAWALKITEGALYIISQTKNEKDPSQLGDFWNCLWCVIVTMTTIGYGDYYPRSILGRILAGFIAFWGIFTTSLLIVVFQQILNMSDLEECTFNILNCLSTKAKLQIRAAYIISIISKKKKQVQSSNSNYYCKTVGKDESVEHRTQKLFTYSKEFQIVSRDLKQLKRQAYIQQHMKILFDQIQRQIKSLLFNQLRLKQYIENSFKLIKHGTRK